jgi:hypothetical protein
MDFKEIVLFLLAIFLVGTLFFYWIVPLDRIDFIFEPKNYSFAAEGESDFQFYPNMRFPSSNISYTISERCTLEKKYNMKDAFGILATSTPLEFFDVPYEGEILIDCDSKTRIEGGMFIAGEGGPTNITSSGNYNVITGGQILLLRNSNCPRPNVAIHELLHVLGFSHTNNPSNIMYNFSSCDQEIGDDIINLLKELYQDPSYPDLLIKDASANVRGRYLNLNFSIANYGLASSSASKVLVRVKNKTEKTIDLAPLDIGYGLSLSLENVYISQRNFERIELIIDNDFEELDKKNNKIELITIGD